MSVMQNEGKLNSVGNCLDKNQIVLTLKRKQLLKRPCGAGRVDSVKTPVQL